jgi:transposase
LESTTWLACLSVVVDAGGDLAALAEGGLDAFTAAARTHAPRFGVSRLYHRIVRGFYPALSDPGGVAAQRPGALERVGLVLADWRTTQARLSDVESRMVGVLDALGLTALVTSIPGLSAVGGAVILAETGELSRFASARSVVKHAGLNPAENTSATFRGQTQLSRRGRPGLRLAAWRAVWGALPHNRVLAAKYTHLTGRETDPLAPAQARAACAATLLRWLHAIITSRQAWDPDIAAGRTRPGTTITAVAA